MIKKFSLKGEKAKIRILAVHHCTGILPASDVSPAGHTSVVTPDAEYGTNMEYGNQRSYP